MNVIRMKMKLCKRNDTEIQNTVIKLVQSDEVSSFIMIMNFTGKHDFLFPIKYFY